MNPRRTASYYLGLIVHRVVNRAHALEHAFLQAHYTKRIKRVGAGVRFNGRSKLTGLDSIEIGDNVHIGGNAFIRGEGGLSIGDNTHIARNLVLYTHSHQFEGQCLPYDDTRRDRPVVIGKNVWIGINVTVLPGTVIEDGAIIGAGSVVHGTVPTMEVYGAAAARRIKTRDRERYQSLERQGRYGGRDGVPLQPMRGARRCR